MGIGGHIHVEVVTEKIAFPMGVPSPVAVRLGIQAFAAAGRTAIFLTIADPFFPLLSGSPYRGAITGKSQMGWIHQSVLNRTIQELLAIEPENKGKTVYFGGIDKAKFKRKVVPGDVLTLELEIIKQKGPIGMGTAKATVDGKVAASAELTFAVG